MKKVFILLFLFSSIGYAQKRRSVVFDADTTTRPEAGFYGVGVRDSQPYLIRPSGNALMVNVSPSKIKGWQFNANGTAPIDAQILAVNKDSLTVDLPNATDSTQGLAYTVCYFGWKDSSMTFFDSTYRLNFVDTIFALTGSGIVYWTNEFTHNHNDSFFRIKPYQCITLYSDERKWWLINQSIKY